jgi:hypothetical protein
MLSLSTLALKDLYSCLPVQVCAPVPSLMPNFAAAKEGSLMRSLAALDPQRFVDCYANVTLPVYSKERDLNDSGLQPYITGLPDKLAGKLDAQYHSMVGHQQVLVMEYCNLGVYHL